MADLTHDPLTDDPRHRFPQLVRLLEEGMGRLHTGVQVYVSLEGRAVANFGIGESRPGLPMTPEVIVPWLSAGKPVTAAAVLTLCDSQGLSLDAPIADVVPEFAAGGKRGVSLRHVLTHTAGFRHVEIGWPAATWEESLRRVCEAEIEEGWVPGERAGYHVASSWVILGEFLSRITQRPFAEAIRSTVLDPADMTDSHCGMSAEAWRAAQGRIGGLLQRDRATLTLSEWHTEEWCTAPSPGGNFRGPISELGAFYEALCGFRGTPLLRAETLAAMTDRQREGMFDETLQHVVDFGLGVIVDSNRYGAETVPYGFGRHCSETTFGHGGSQCSIGFVDRRNRLVVCWAANGRPGEPQHQRRNRAANEAIYADLGLD